MKCPKHWKPLFVLIVFSYPKFAFVACHSDMEHLGEVFCVSFVPWILVAKPEVWGWLFETYLEMEGAITISR